MPTISLVSIVVSLVMGGGLLTAVAAVFKTRAELQTTKQARAKLPAEVDSIWLGGAEKTVSLLQVALDRTEAQVVRLDARVIGLENQLHQVGDKLDVMSVRNEKLVDRNQELIATNKQLVQEITRLTQKGE